MYDNARFFSGIVVNGDDSKTPHPHQGRVQVRIFGVHTPVKTAGDGSPESIPDEDCPWCMCAVDPIYGGGSTENGSIPSPILNPGAFVFGVSLDETYQNNIILGLLCVPKQLSALATNNSGAGTDGLMPNSTQDALNNLPEDCQNKFFQKVILPIESGDWETGSMKSAKNRSGEISDAGNVAVNTNAGNGITAHGYSQLTSGRGGSIEDLCDGVKSGKVKITGLDPNMSKDEMANLIKSNANVNIAAGAAYFKSNRCLYGVAGGNPVFGAIAYNCGPGRITNFFKYCSSQTGCQPNANSCWNLGSDKLDTLYNSFMTSQGKASEKDYMKKITSIMNKNQDLQDCMKQAEEGKVAGAMGVNSDGGDLNSVCKQMQGMSKQQVINALGDKANNFYEGAWCSMTAVSLSKIDGRNKYMSQSGLVLDQINYAIKKETFDYSKNGGMMVGDLLMCQPSTVAGGAYTGSKSSWSHIVTVTAVNGDSVTISHGNYGNKFVQETMSASEAARRYPAMSRIGKYSTCNK